MKYVYVGWTVCKWLRISRTDEGILFKSSLSEEEIFRKVTFERTKVHPIKATALQQLYANPTEKFATISSADWFIIHFVMQLRLMFHLMYIGFDQPDLDLEISDEEYIPKENKHCKLL